MNKTLTGGIFYNPIMLDHENSLINRPSNRLKSIVTALITEGLWNDYVFEASIAPMKRIKDVHCPEYLEALHKKSIANVENLDEFTLLLPKTFESARYGAGAVIDAIDTIMSNVIKNAVCLNPMPGHLAKHNSHLYGNIINYAAVGAHFLVKKYNLERVAIFDLDANHCKGTQEIFWKRKDILVISIHEYPGKLGTGHYTEIGDKTAQGFNINIPIPSGYSDREYILCFNEIALPILYAFNPQFIIISWGTNNLADGSKSRLLVTEYAIFEVTRSLYEFAQQKCNGRIIAILEDVLINDYNPKAFIQLVKLFLNFEIADVDKMKKVGITSYTDWYNYSKVLKNYFKRFWKI